MIEFMKERFGPIVIKVGTRMLTQESGSLDALQFVNIAAQIAAIRHTYKVPVILVSSGAIACGAQSQSIALEDLPGKQAAASVGQVLLMQRYLQVFLSHGISVGQVLLTKDGLENEERLTHAKNTIRRLLDLGIIPIINENDTVAVEEIQFGDNDNLAARVAQFMSASALILLTDTDGVYTANPKLDSSAKKLDVLNGVSDVTLGYVTDLENGKSRGGMRSKLLCAKVATESGIPTVIANGRHADVLISIFAGESVGTRLLPLID